MYIIEVKWILFWFSEKFAIIIVLRFDFNLILNWDIYLLFWFDYNFSRMSPLSGLNMYRHFRHCYFFYYFITMYIIEVKWLQINCSDFLEVTWQICNCSEFCGLKILLILNYFKIIGIKKLFFFWKIIHWAPLNVITVLCYPSLNVITLKTLIF